MFHANRVFHCVFLACTPHIYILIHIQTSTIAISLHCCYLILLYIVLLFSQFFFLSTDYFIRKYFFSRLSVVLIFYFYFSYILLHTSLHHFRFFSLDFHCSVLFYFVWNQRKRVGKNTQTKLKTKGKITTTVKKTQLHWIAKCIQIVSNKTTTIKYSVHNCPVRNYRLLHIKN